MKFYIILLSLVLCLLLLVGCATVTKKTNETTTNDHITTETPELAIATFAGGCFWCMEPPFEKLEGVTEVIVGYTGGHIKNPTYDQVSSGESGHVEAVQLLYDPTIVSFEELLDVYWKQIDPTDDLGQFADKGKHYATVIFFHDKTQKKLAEESKQKLADSGKFEDPIVTRIEAASIFYKAEEYHQDYAQKHPIAYYAYKKGSGRAGFIEENWGNESK